MAVLIGKTGFVGGHLASKKHFEVLLHRPDLHLIKGFETDLLVCAGVPAEKWRANQNPIEDFNNISSLAQVLMTVSAKKAVLISTIDVYQPALGINEFDPVSLDGNQMYGAHRAWFEMFFRAKFPDALIMRLPALFAPDVKKNLIHDLLHGKSDQWQAVNPSSTFQFFDVRQTWSLIEKAWTLGLKLLNVTSEPISAQTVASIFNVTLSGKSKTSAYDMRSYYAEKFGGNDGYLFSKSQIINEITSLLNLDLNP